jgi:hypothetical protein
MIGAAAVPLALAGLDGSRAAAGPVTLDETGLDGVAAGTVGFPDPGTSRLWRSTNITTSISIPMSTAIAVCYLCSGDASAVAIANAIGSGLANSLAFSSGQADTFAFSNAIGPYLIFTAPPTPTGAGGSPLPK